VVLLSEALRPLALWGTAIFTQPFRHRVVTFDSASNKKAPAMALARPLRDARSTGLIAIG
jgi:hypothetical protein